MHIFKWLHILHWWYIKHRLRCIWWIACLCNLFSLTRMSWTHKKITIVRICKARPSLPPNTCGIIALGSVPEPFLHFWWFYWQLISHWWHGITKDQLFFKNSLALDIMNPLLLVCCKMGAFVRVLFFICFSPGKRYLSLTSHQWVNQNLLCY